MVVAGLTRKGESIGPCAVRGCLIDKYALQKATSVSRLAAGLVGLRHAARQPARLVLGLTAASAQIDWRPLTRWRGALRAHWHWRRPAVGRKDGAVRRSEQAGNCGCSEVLVPATGSASGGHLHLYHWHSCYASP
jgi:hypothetical protein